MARSPAAVPFSAIMASSCSTKSGLPSAASVIRLWSSGVDLGLALQVAEQLLGLEGRERREHDRLADGVPLGVAVEQVGPGEAENEDRSLPAPADHVLDELDESRLCPLEIVEAHDERPLARQVLEQPADGPHRLFGRRRTVADPNRRGHLACDPFPVGLPGEQLVEPAPVSARRPRRERRLARAST